MDIGNNNHRQQTTWGLAIIFPVFVALLIIHSSYYLPFFSDDALISLRYLDRFLEGDGLTWTDGIRVEGYSNLLWILLLACPGVFNVDLIDAARILGIASMSVVILSAQWWYTRVNALKQVWLPLVTGLLFFCLSAPVAVWAIGGLEQPLYAALLAVAIPLCITVIESDSLDLGKTLLASLMLGLMCITRPDGPLFAIAAVAAFILVGSYLKYKRPVLTILLLLLFPMAFYIGQIVFRFFYYGEIVPNTALVKLAFSSHRVIAGMQYVIQGLLSLAPFSLFAVVSLIISLRSSETRARAILLLVMSVLWLVYVALIGGDIFPAWRHLIPVIVIFMFAIIDGMLFVGRYIEQKNAVIRAVFVAGLLALFAGYLLIQFNEPKNKKAVFERWEWDGKVVGLLLKKAFTKQQPLIAVSAAGCLPYWSGLPALDMLGLNDYYLPRHPPTDFGRGFIGHELGSGAYVLDRKPDIIIFHVGLLNDGFRSGREMQQTSEFHEHYAAINVVGTEPHRHTATLWFRKYSTRIGIQQSPHALVIPGFLLNANPDTVAFLNSRDELVISVVEGQPAGIVITLPSPGQWFCQAKTSQPGIGCKVESRGSMSEITVETGSERPIEIEKIMLHKRANPNLEPIRS